jgi:hypothetical protein
MATVDANQCTCLRKDGAPMNGPHASPECSQMGEDLKLFGLLCRLPGTLEAAAMMLNLKWTPLSRPFWDRN